MHVAIIGNGIAGVTAAQRIRALQPDWRVTVISGESRYHYSRPALMYVWMGHMRYADTKPYEDGHWDRQRIDLLRDWVTRIDTDARRLILHRGDPIAYDRLLLATGSKPNRFGWKGQHLDGVQGLYDLMDLQLLRENTRDCSRAVIVGGGLIGIELGEMLHTQGIHVTFLVREKSYWGNVLPREESEMVNRLVRAHGFDLRLDTQLAEMTDDGSGRVGGVVTDGGDRIECRLVGLTAGVSPNLDLVEDTDIATGRGVRVDASLRTNVDGVFAAGDCAELVTGADLDGPGRLEQVWYTGKEQGEVAGDVIAGRERSYESRIWYNSAKFLDLEYQVYGRVNRHVPGERSLYWEHADGRHAVRLVHVDGTLIGVNVMGMRYRHLVCEEWIREGRDVEYVLSHLADAHFDPEFYRRHEGDIAPALRDAYRGEGREAAA